MKYPVLLLAGRDTERRELMQVLDPDEKYKSKALIPLLGKTILEWVAEEFLKSPYVDEVFVLGLSEDDIKLNGPIYHIPIDLNTSIGQKYRAGLDYLIENNKVQDELIYCSSDCPGIKVEAINTFIEHVHNNKGYDFIATTVPEDVVETSFPDSGRGVARLRDENYTQGELACVSPKLIIEHQHEIDEFTELGTRRKRSFMTIIRLVAKRPSTWYRLFKIIIGRGKLEDVIIAFSRAFKLKADAVVINDAGLAFDMDLPQDYKKLEKYLAKIKNIPLKK